MSTALRLTVAEYDRMVALGAFDELEKKIELINGEIRMMNPAGPVHDDLIEFLNDWSVRGTQSDEIRVRIQSGLSLPEFDSRPEPDVLWVKARRYRDRHPLAEDALLLIEVSNSSLQSDRDEKVNLYAQAGIVEYWIVNVPDQSIQVFRDPESSGYRTLSTHGVGDTVTPLAQPNLELNISQLFSSE